MADVSSIATVEKYCALVGTDALDELLDLFSAEATVEDPVGTPVRDHPDAVREFYATLVGTGTRLELRGPIAGDDHNRAFLFTVHTGDEFSMDVIDVMTFDDDAKITSMRAFWAMG